MTEQTIAQGQEDDSSGLVRLLALIWRRKGVVAATFVIFVVATIITVFAVTPKYTARATFVPPPDEAGGVASILRNPISAFTGGLGSASVDRLVGFLDSETARTRIIKDYDLVNHYDVEYMTHALWRLEGETRITVTPEGLVTVDVTDVDPKLAAKMANSFVDITDSLHRLSQQEHAGQMRRFLETRVEAARRDMEAAEIAARNFGETTGIVSLENQVAVLVEQIAQIDAQITEVDIRIGAARQILGPRHSSVREMEIERAALVSERRKLMESNGGSPDADPLLTLANVPDRAVEYFRLQREIEIQTIIQELLYRQYEISKLEEARNVSTLARVDRATVPELKSWPMRTRLVVLSAVMGLVWGVLMAWFVENGPHLVARITGRERA